MKRIFILVALAFLLFPAQAAHAENLAGKRLKVYGEWTGTELIARKLKTRDSNKDPETGQIEGRIERLVIEKGKMKIGPFLIQWGKTTRIQKIQFSDLKVGMVVKVRVRKNGENRFFARKIKPGSDSLKPNQLKIIGAVTSFKKLPDGVVKVAILDAFATIPKGIRAEVTSLTRRPDDKRPDTQYTVSLFGRPLTIGGEYGLSTNWEGDTGLNTKERDVFELNQELQLELFYAVTPLISLFVSFDTFDERELYVEDKTENRESKTGVERDETWVFFKNLLDSNFSMQVGRINFVEPREWWWDEDLDAVRVFYDRHPFYFQVGVAKELGVTKTTESGIDPEEENVIRVLGQAGFEWARKNRFEFFFLTQNDVSNTDPVLNFLKKVNEDESDAHLTWLGLRAIGKARSAQGGYFSYWLDGAVVVGQESLLTFSSVNEDVTQVTSSVERDVFGWAFDGGLSWTFPLKWEPTLTVGYAIGSGDKNEKGPKDNSFRQTGLDDNNSKFNGVDSFRYYGELVRPELSNLHILTASIGTQILNSSSIELVYHHYRQVKAASFLRDTKIRLTPSGVDADIGQELDFIVGLEEWEHVELELVNAWFWAGDAFGARSGNMAFNSVFKFNYNF